MKIDEFNPWWKTREIESIFENMKRRDNFNEIVKYVKSKQIIVITGLRRTGKTVLMYHLIDYLLKNQVKAENIVYFNFDFMVGDIEGVFDRYKAITNIDYKNEKIYVFLDEVQKLKDWQNKIKIYYDLYPNIKFFVSGSSSLFIRKRTKESLAGRSFDFQISPLTFVEYLKLKNEEKAIKNPVLYKKEIREELKEYIKTGGFPELIYEKDNLNIKKYVKELVIDKIVYIDIPEVFKIDEPALLQTLISIISSSPGMIMDYDSIATDLKRNRKTISNYLFYLEEAFLIKKIYNFSKNKLTSEKKSKKFYPVTTSLAFLYDSDYGKIIESAVLQNFNFKFFYRKADKEVDFIGIDNKSILPIEVKARKNINKEMEKSLLDFMKKFKAEKGFIITEDYEEEKKAEWFGAKGKIKFIPLWKWLLER
ncbi:MAG: ATP-binding protein [Nanoarchaeota archaeon]|nr:ATP-binding protein [Nanoarchaeota archaeon]